MDKRLKEIVDKSEKIVFFGGAGVSTESGIPDFRSEDGLYNAKQNYGYAPEEMLSHTFFMQNTEMFFDYYKKNLICTWAEPNKAHLALAKLERDGKLTSVVTQNIDGLHQKAGSKRVHELHGSVLRNRCMKCGHEYDLKYVMEEANCGGKAMGVPRCKRCGGIVKPDVVLYEEPLDSDTITDAINDIVEADCLIIGGTSLTVYPAAGFISYFKGKYLVLINKTQTQYDKNADLVIYDKIGEVLGE